MGFRIPSWYKYRVERRSNVEDEEWIEALIFKVVESHWFDSTDVA